MNYEVKSVSPGSVFWNAARISLIIGFVYAVYSFYLGPNAMLRVFGFAQKLFALALFTGVYGLVMSLICLLLCLLYNLWTREFSPKPFYLQALWPSLIVGGFLGAVTAIGDPAHSGFFVRLFRALLFTVVATPLLAALITLFAGLAHAAFGSFKGIKIHLEQE